VSEQRDTRAVFGYVRVSTDQQETERQEQTLPTRHASLPDGLSLNELELFYDHGISAFTGKQRPGFNEMFDRIKNREASALLIDTSSRLTRQGIREALTLLFTLQDADCRLFTTTGKEYAADVSGYVSLIIDAEGDNAYSRNLSHNTSTGKHTNSSQGYWPHGKVPLGYESIPADDNPTRKVLRPLEPEASTVREAFRLADEEHAPLREIVRYLGRTLGRSFDRSYARNSLLCNVAYIGKVRCKGKVYEGRHPALVSAERFERVQRRLALGAGGNPRRPRTSPFAGIARCASCGRTLRYRLITSGNGRDTYPYLFCTDNSLTDKCQQKGIRGETFDASFAMLLGSLAFALRRHLDADPDIALDLVDSRADSKGVTIQVYRPTGRPQYATATADLKHVTLGIPCPGAPPSRHPPPPLGFRCRGAATDLGEATDLSVEPLAALLDFVGVESGVGAQLDCLRLRRARVARRGCVLTVLGLNRGRAAPRTGEEWASESARSRSSTEQSSPGRWTRRPGRARRRSGTSCSDSAGSPFCSRSSGRVGRVAAAWDAANASTARRRRPFAGATRLRAARRRHRAAALGAPARPDPSWRDLPRMP
jgi:DNA invertase Pin-like site-specific DNA recombinase